MSDDHASFRLPAVPVLTGPFPGGAGILSQSSDREAAVAQKINSSPDVSEENAHSAQDSSSKVADEPMRMYFYYPKHVDAESTAVLVRTLLQSWEDQDAGAADKGDEPTNNDA
jgi:hypothetical protein